MACVAHVVAKSQTQRMTFTSSSPALIRTERDLPSSTCGLQFTPRSLEGLTAFLVWPPHHTDKVKTQGDSILLRVTQGQRYSGDQSMASPLTLLAWAPLGEAPVPKGPVPCHHLEPLP